MTPVIAIYDIGKTNKKLILYDSSYTIRWETQTSLPEGRDDDGDPCEDIKRLSGWIQSTWEDVTQRFEFRIDALHFTTYGASFVHLDGEGKPAAPLYSYFKPIPEEITDPFYERYGGMINFAVETASPAMGMLNSGLQLYWLKKKKPRLFSNIKTSLHLPNYCSYIFTGVAGSELTSIGCHTALWDYRKKQYHRWLEDEGIISLLPPIHTEIKTGAIPQNKRSITVGLGLHDSSAALVPYLQSFHTPFILLSTGTWCVNLFPFAEQPLSEYQLERDCLSYLTFQGTEVRASRNFLGGEHDHQVERLAEHFHCPTDTYKTIPYNPAMTEKIITRTNAGEYTLKPNTMRGTGPMPDIGAGTWDLSQFTSYEEAYHQLIVDISCIVCMSLELINEGKKDVDLFIDGGFSNNQIFMSVLASLFPQANVRSSQIGQATSLGAALSMHSYWESDESVVESMFNLKKYRAMHNGEIVTYYNEYYKRNSLSK